MTGKITQGSSFGGAVDYIMGKKDAELLDADGIRAYDIKLATIDFETIANQNERVKKPVFHISLSFHKNDEQYLNNEKMSAIAKEMIVGMGFSDCQSLIVRHHDGNNPHLHIILNRVSLDGKTISDKYCKLKFNNIRKAIELKYSELTSASVKNLNKINDVKLKGKDAVRFKIHKAINIEIQNSRNIAALILNLEKNHGIKTQLKYRSGSIEHIDGIKFHLENTWITGSKVDKSCSYLNLLKQMDTISKNQQSFKESNKSSSNNNQILQQNFKSFLSNNTSYDNGKIKAKSSWIKDDELER